MKYPLLTLCLLLFFNHGQSQEVINGSIQHDGLDRDYILYVPASFEDGNPMVMNFHGYSSNAMEQMIYGDFQDLADQHGFLLIHPDGTEDNTGTTHWNVGWGFSSVDDVGFISALIDSLHSSYAINLERVYSTGMSNGGFISYYLACNLSERIAAIASVTGAMTVGDFDTCSPSHPMPIMEIHGTADAVVSYNGSFAFEGSADVVNFWAEFNDILSPPFITPVPDIDPNDGCTAERWLFEGGSNGSTVEHYKIFDGGHTWPGSDIVVGTTNQDFNASEVIWEFFSQYDINGLIIVDEIAEIQPELSIDLWPNPATDNLRIEGLGIPTTYLIIDAQGRLVDSGSLNGASELIDLNGLSAGIHSLLLENGATARFVIE